MWPNGPRKATTVPMMMKIKGDLYKRDIYHYVNILNFMKPLNYDAV
jgi:hypothetical protein